MALLAAGFLVMMLVPHLMKMKKSTKNNAPAFKGDPFLIIFILGLTFLALTPAEIENRFLISSFLWAFVTFVLVKLYIWPSISAAKESDHDKQGNGANLEFEIQSAVIFLFIVFVITGMVS